MTAQGGTGERVIIDLATGRVIGVDANPAIRRKPAETGPMRAAWSPATPRLLRALQRLRDETSRAQNAAQTGAPISGDLYSAFTDFMEAEAAVYCPRPPRTLAEEVAAGLHDQPHP